MKRILIQSTDIISTNLLARVLGKDFEVIKQIFSSDDGVSGRTLNSPLDLVISDDRTEYEFIPSDTFPDRKRPATIKLTSEANPQPNPNYDRIIKKPYTKEQVLATVKELLEDQ